MLVEGEGGGEEGGEGEGMGLCFFFQAEDGIRDRLVTGVQTCALPICIVVSGGSYVDIKSNTDILLVSNKRVTPVHPTTQMVQSLGYW